MTRQIHVRILIATTLAVCVTLMPLLAQNRNTTTVVHVPAGDAASTIQKAIAAKMPQLATGSNFNMMVLIRAEAGTPEFHAKRVHVFFIQDGEATFVSGGSIEGAKDTGPGEIRGTSIANGTTMTLRKDDVVVVPAGTPHWFKEVRPKVTYFSVNIDQP